MYLAENGGSSSKKERTAGGRKGPSETDSFSISLMLISRVFRNFSAGLVNVVFPYIILIDLHQGSFTLGLIYTTATIATAILGFVIGFATDTSPKVTFVVALALLPASTLILSIFFNSLAAAFIAAIIGGYSQSGSLSGGGVGGFIQPIQSTITANITDRSDRTFYFGLLSFLGGIGLAAGAFAGGFPTVFDGLVLATVASSISVLPVIFIRVKKASDRIRRNGTDRAENEKLVTGAMLDDHANRSNRLHLKSAKAIGKFSITGMINGFANGLVIPFLIPFFILTYGVPRSEMGLFTFISGLIGAFALLLGPTLEHNLGFLKGVITTRGATVVLALIFPFVHFLPLSLGIYFVLPALRVVAFPVVQSAMTDMVTRDEIGRAFGINQGGRLTVTSAGIAFAGYEFDQSSYYIPFMGYAIVLTVNLFLYARFFSNYKDPFRERESTGS